MKASTRRHDLWQLQNGKCCWCGLPVNLGGASIEHIIPQSMGGKNTLSNLAVSHVKCNKDRGSNYLQEPHPSFLFEHVRKRLKEYHAGVARQDISKLGLPVPAVRWS
jgi:5-methylcytosine-specific restriction endonuclease McrA